MGPGQTCVAAGILGCDAADLFPTLGELTGYNKEQQERLRYVRVKSRLFPPALFRRLTQATTTKRSIQKTDQPTIK